MTDGRADRRTDRQTDESDFIGRRPTNVKRSIVYLMLSTLFGRSLNLRDILVLYAEFCRWKSFT